jgi:hypothetical protein
LPKSENASATASKRFENYQPPRAANRFLTPFSSHKHPAGTIEVMYHDALRPLLTAGEGHIRRASRVEPTAEGSWTADLTPMRGPVLGPYLTRADALTAETEWLTQNWLRRQAYKMTALTILT